MAVSGLDADAPDTSKTIIARAWSGRDGDQIIRDIDTGEAGWAAWLHMQAARIPDSEVRTCPICGAEWCPLPRHKRGSPAAADLRA